MKILLAGAFGNLGIEILRVLCEGGHEVIAADLKEKENNGLEGKYTFRAIDATKKETMKGICDGIEVVITTMGLTTSSTKFTAYDIDYQGNLNLLEEAKASGVGKFNYISVIACKEPGAEKVPMLHAKAMFEDELVKSGLEYVIYRPTGYFYDIAKVFKPYVDKGEMQLLKGYHGVKANVVDCPDFAVFIAEHMLDTNAVYEVGGKETYTYEEMAKLCTPSRNKLKNTLGGDKNASPGSLLCRKSMAGFHVDSDHRLGARVLHGLSRICLVHVRGLRLRGHVHRYFPSDLWLC